LSNFYMWCNKKTVVCSADPSQLSLTLNGWCIMLAGFLIRPSGPTGSELGYVSQTDPQGTLPPWLVNKVTQIFAPKVSNFNPVVVC
jgi:hypothetical protein